MKSQNPTLGLVAAPPTAFLEDGSIDLAFVAPMARHLEDQGAAGAFVNGTTGEGASLSTEERAAQAEAWRRSLPDTMRLFVHAGHTSLPEARRLAAHAQEIGADAVAVIAPYFYKPSNLAAVVDWCAAIASAAPKLPFYFYHMPSMSGVSLSVARFLEAAGPRIPNLAGIKFTFEAMADYQEALRLENGRYDVLWGRDEMLLGALAEGARGGVGSTYNVAAPIYLRLIHAFEQGDMETARKHQAEACELIQAMIDSGHFFGALKYLLHAQGLPISPRMRLPNATAPAQAFAALDQWAERLKK